MRCGTGSGPRSSGQGPGESGFVSGWTTPAPFRADRAYGSVLDRLGSERVWDFLIGAFEIDQLGVIERARGTGLGRHLLSLATRNTHAPGS